VTGSTHTWLKALAFATTGPAPQLPADPTLPPVGTYAVPLEVTRSC